MVLGMVLQAHQSWAQDYNSQKAQRKSRGRFLVRFPAPRPVLGDAGRRPEITNPPGPGPVVSCRPRCPSMRRLGSVQRKMPCAFVTEVREEPSGKREQQVPAAAARGRSCARARGRFAASLWGGAFSFLQVSWTLVVALLSWA